MEERAKVVFPQSERIPEDLKKCIIDFDVEEIVGVIAVDHHLDKNVYRAFVHDCQKYIFQFNSYTSDFVPDFTSVVAESNIVSSLATAFKEKILVPIKESLKSFNITVEKEVENVFYKSGKMKITDKFIHYSDYSTQPIVFVSNIGTYKNLWHTKYTVSFEVFIPEKGRWGSVDRPAISFSTEKEASDFIKVLEKAISWGNFRNRSSFKTG